MPKKIISKPWVVYPGSTIQQNYAEEESHGYILWDINNKNEYDISYIELENNYPFITLVWNADFERFKLACSKIKEKSRIRVVSDHFVTPTDVQLIKKFLREAKNPSEIIFKTNPKSFSNITSTTINGKQIEKSDISSYTNLLDLLRDFSKQNKTFDFNENDWRKIEEITKTFVDSLSTENSFKKTWEINKMEFSNLFSYGDNNEINFSKLNGVIGILGQNRIGKSSIIGSILYCLFNVSDRGPLKNVNFVNTRKKQGEATIYLTADGREYVISRRTIKTEKKGEITATTKVSLLEIGKEGNLIELNGEQRNETDKIIRSMIGTADNFLLTTFSSQSDINRFINEGSTHRKHILTRFLGLDVFEKLSEEAKENLSYTKHRIKELEQLKLENNISDLELKITSESNRKIQILNDVESLKLKINESNVILEQNNFSKKEEYKNILDKIDCLISTLSSSAKKKVELISNLASLKNKHEFEADRLKKLELETEERYKEASVLSEHMNQLRSELKTIENNILVKKESSKILDEVPCGDSYLSSCKFIKNAFLDKKSLPEFQEKYEEGKGKYLELLQKYKEYEPEKLKEKIVEQRKINSDLNESIRKITMLESEVKNIDLNSEKMQNDLETLQEKERELQKSFGIDNDINFIFKLIDDALTIKKRAEIDLKIKEEQGIAVNVNIEIIKNNLEQLREKLIERNKIISDNKVNEFLFYSFSKNGISARIISEQLPIVNNEIQNILSEIVDYTIELKMEGDYLEVYIVYSENNKRLIELCSGMEKFIASMAIRVALTNISNLPKTNIFILDEGFGSLDESGLEACNKMLISLKRYFKSVLIITHVDAMKESVDRIIDIVKLGQDSQVVFK